MRKKSPLFYHITIATCLLFFNLLKAQEMLPPKYSVDGQIRSTVTIGDTLVLGGSFTSVGIYTGGGAFFNVPEHTPDLNLPKFNGSVYCTAPDGNGGMYIYGNYYREDENPDAQHKRIEHLLPNATFENDFTFTVNVWGQGITKLIVYNNILYGCGYDIETINNTNVGNFFAINTTSREIVSWIPDINGSVNSIGAYNGILYFSGAFNLVGGIARENNAAIEIGTGNVTQWEPAISGGFNDIKFYNENAILGGGFHDGTFTEHACAIVDVTTGQSVQYLLTSEAEHTNHFYWAASVGRMTLSGNMLYVSGRGTFDTVIAAINLSTNTVVWRKYLNMIADCHDILVHDGNVYAVGWAFTNIYQGQLQEVTEANITGLISLDAATGNFNSNWRGDIMGQAKDAHCLNMFNDKLFAGGDFSHVNGALRSNICMIDTTNDILLPFKVDFSYFSWINALKIDGSTLYVGGELGSVADVEYNVPLLAFDINTAAILPWHPPISGNCRALETIGNIVYAGGSLTTTGDNGRQHLFAINKNDASLATWHPNPNQPVNALYITNDTLYAGGEFSSIANQPRSQLASFNRNLDISNWDPSPDGYVNTITSDNDGAIWIGGNFNNVGSVPSYLISGINAINGQVVHSPLTGGYYSIFSISAKGNWVIAGGELNLSDENPCNTMIMYNKQTNTLANDFCMNFSSAGNVYTIAPIGNDIYFGGNFLGINQRTQAKGLNRLGFEEGFFDDEVAGLTNSDKVKTGITVFPNPASNHVTIKINNDTAVTEVSLSDVLGNKIPIEFTILNNQLHIDLEKYKISDGLYFINIKSNGIIYSKKIAVKN